ncbi:cadmium resistance transporter [Aurantimonas coralicida]|uniref:cadmium resistance transporter n=1 Tax=Aurantimonas coralicida TaxID=182270 RepID=UPI001D18A33E|nr:cadmium resistance transporter [Aurantimonas coralicida]MCC4300089.1 cadmium resistance transporter [Aurantimonas coralicida]
MLSVIAAAVSAFVATNIDDIFVLMLFFSQVGPDLRSSDIYAGQYLGFAAIVAVSFLGFVAGFLLPRPWIGLLGFVPIAIGIRHIYAGREKADGFTSFDGRSTASRGGVLGRAVRPQILNVAAVTFANGGDNFGIYIPFFAAMRPSALGVTVATFFGLIAVWCWLGSTLSRVPAIGRALRRYSQIIVPFVFIGLGLYILAENESYRLLYLLDGEIDELLGPVGEPS